MPPDPEKQEAGVGAEASEAPEEAGGESADAKKTQEARHDLGDETAKDTSEPKAERNEKFRNLAKDLPNNKWKEAYFQLLEQTEKHPELNGQLTDAVLAMMLFLAKYAHYMDRIPGFFEGSLNNDVNLKDEKLSEEEIATVVNQKKGAPKETLTEEQKEKFKAMGVEKASVSYVANKLFGMTDVDSPHQLAAKILHAKKTVETGEVDEDLEPETEEIPCYKSVNLDFLKENGMPFGTVLIFTPNEQKGEKVTAYATGNGDEIEFIDGNGDITRANLNLNNKESALISSQWDLQIALVPKFNSDPDYFAKHPKDFDVRLTEPAKAEAKPATTPEVKPEAPKAEPEKKPVSLKTSKELKDLKEKIGEDFGDLVDLVNFEGEVFEGEAVGLDFMNQKDIILVQVSEMLDKKLVEVSKPGELERLTEFFAEAAGGTVDLGSFIADVYTTSMLQVVEESFKEVYPLSDKLPKKDEYEIGYKVEVVDGGVGFKTEFKVDEAFEADYKKLT